MVRNLTDCMASPRRPRLQRSTLYPLERLYVDQEHDHVKEVIAPLLAWLPDNGRAVPPFVFEMRHVPRGRTVRSLRLEITWDDEALKRYDADVLEGVRRMRTGHTALAEKRTELAGYALALVAISVLLPGRRVLAWRPWSAPDILLDVTPGALRGVEVAARARGGWGALRTIAEGSRVNPGKRHQLCALPDVTEAHLSLWCRTPRVAMMLKVKP
jgi:hypothetical protein